MNSMKQSIIFRLLAALMAFNMLLASTAWASDVVVYNNSDNTGTKTVMLMVDVSQGMGTPTVDLLRDYPFCLSTTALTNLVPSGLGLPNISALVDPSTTVAQGGYCDILIPVSLINLLQTADGVVGGNSGLLGLKGIVSYIMQSCDPLTTGLGAIIPGEYRCYSRLKRAQMGVANALNGVPSQGIAPLPDSTVVGLSMFPTANSTTSGATVTSLTGPSPDDRAGMIVVPARALNAIVPGTAITQRQYIINTINSYQGTSSGLSITGLTTQLTNLVTAIASNAVSSIASVFNNPFQLLGVLDGVALSSVSSLVATATNSINSILTSQLGLGSGNTPTASAYAETGAYMMGTSTKGTGVRQEVKMTTGLLGTYPTYQQCTAWTGSDPTQCTTWGANQCTGGLLGIGMTCPATPAAPNYQAVTNSDLLTTLVTLFGLLGSQTMYYGYDAAYDSAYSGFKYTPNGQGIMAGADNHSSSTSYSGPALSASSDSCSGQGIYVLTGNVPRIQPTVSDTVIANTQGNTGYGPAITTAVGQVMNKSLTGGSSSAFSCPGSLPSGWVDSVGNANGASWECIQGYSQRLLSGTSTSNPPGKIIKTGVGGIGREFVNLPEVPAGGTPDCSQVTTSFLGQITNTLSSALSVLVPSGSSLLSSLLGNVLPLGNPEDICNMAYWGAQSGGGWTPTPSAQSVANSIQTFVGNLPSATPQPYTAASFTPADSLNPYELQPYAYRPMFQITNGQVWFGNIKKYTALTSQIGTNDLWASAANTTSTDVFTGGMLDKLNQLAPIVATGTARTLVSNRSCQSGAFQESTGLTTLTGSGLVNGNTSCVSGQTSYDPMRGYLLALLGYDVSPALANNPTGLTLSSLNALPAQIGSPMHSKPIMLTQSATVNTDGSVAAGSRDAYILFGTNQGLVHAVKMGSSDTDTTGGTEMFAFVPNEMLNSSKQRQTFLKKNNTGHYVNMAYGVDAPWTAYSEYVLDSTSGKYTVGSATTANNKTLNGKQYVYGGLRMGGQSYYALNLQNISNPQLMFHIDPASGNVYSPALSGGQQAYSALQSMGQSWSKPTLAWVNWSGQRKLVMFVGGGYDINYESPSYDPGAGSTQGAGVYMFDATTGALLWSAAYGASSSSTATAATDPNMKYSVVSRINAVDRNGDGLVDHLYFGDLGGQLWRIDLDNTLTSGSSNPFAPHVVRLLNLHKTDGSSPRFYEMPTFSVYDRAGSTMAALSINSGDRSSPLQYGRDASVYTVFDKSVTLPNLNQLTQTQLVTAYPSLTSLYALASTAVTDAATISSVSSSEYAAGGWYYSFTNSSNANGVMGELVTINKNLFANVYTYPGTNDPFNCGIGAKGDSVIQRFCLPYGFCSSDLTNATNRLNQGKGIMNINLGASSVTVGGSTYNAGRQILTNTTPASGVGTNVMQAQTPTRKVVPLSWYEKYAQQ